MPREIFHHDGMGEIEITESELDESNHFSSMYAAFVALQRNGFNLQFRHVGEDEESKKKYKVVVDSEETVDKINEILGLMDEGLGELIACIETGDVMAILQAFPIEEGETPEHERLRQVLGKKTDNVVKRAFLAGCKSKGASLMIAVSRIRLYEENALSETQTDEERKTIESWDQNIVPARLELVNATRRKLRRERLRPLMPTEVHELMATDVHNILTRRPDLRP